MTITARHAARRITKVQPVIEQIADHIADTVNAIRQQIDEDRAGRTRAEDVGIRGINWISRPTEDAALANLHQATSSRTSRELDNLAEDIGLLVEVVHRIAATCERHTYSGRPENLQVRRCGEYTPRDIKLEEWYTEPNRVGRIPVSCTNEAWSDVLVDGGKSWRPHGLCVSCYSLRRDWVRRNEQGAA